jgi:hypothetical protein
MTLDRIHRMRRKFFADLALIAALGAIVGAEVASLASATTDLAREPSGLVIDARDETPGGLSVAEPCDRPLFGKRLAAGERAAAAGDGKAL